MLYVLQASDQKLEKLIFQLFLLKQELIVSLKTRKQNFQLDFYSKYQVLGKIVRNQCNVARKVIKLSCLKEVHLAETVLWRKRKRERGLDR